ncbi:hypothetical protein HN587_04625 [Candidatus Woesearchaeota archaeon]|nr:hypothetical protein [Candidatus Woesearchaeota archaeon]
MFVCSLAVEAGFKDTFKSKFSGAKSKFGEYKVKFKEFKLNYLTKQFILSTLATCGVLFVLFMVFLGSKFSDNSSKYVAWAMVFVVAVLITKSMLVEPQEYIWEQKTFLEYKVMGWGCDNGESKIGCTQVNNSPGAYVLSDFPKDVDQGVLKTGTNGEGLPAFIAAFVSLIFVFVIFKDKLGLPDGFYMEFIIPAFIAFSFANDGMTRAIAVLIGGWAALMALSFNLHQNMNSDKPSGFIFGLAFAFVQIIITNVDVNSSLIVWNPFKTNPGPGSAEAILTWIIVGILIGHVKNILSNVGKNWSETYQNLSEKERTRVDQLIEEGHPLKARLSGAIPLLNFDSDEEKLDAELQDGIIGQVAQKLGIPKSKVKGDFKKYFRELHMKDPEAIKDLQDSMDNWKRTKTSMKDTIGLVDKPPLWRRSFGFIGSGIGNLFGSKNNAKSDSPNPSTPAKKEGTSSESKDDKNSGGQLDPAFSS